MLPLSLLKDISRLESYSSISVFTVSIPTFSTSTCLILSQVAVVAVLVVVALSQRTVDLSDISVSISLCVSFSLTLCIILIICGQFFASDPWQVFQAVGIFSFAFVCQDCIFLYYNTLKHGTRERFSRMSFIAIAGSGALTSFFGITGYFTFQVSGSLSLLAYTPPPSPR